jgi:hypothetical protein
MHATVAGCEAAANTHVATAELPACESTAAAKSSATEVTAAAKAAAVATAKTTAVASTAATMTAATAASPSSGEGVSLDRGHPHGDDRENDCYFAQHQNSPYTDALASLDFFRHGAPAARSGRVTNRCRDPAFACLRAIAAAVRVLRQSTLGTRGCKP